MMFDPVINVNGVLDAPNGFLDSDNLATAWALHWKLPAASSDIRLVTVFVLFTSFISTSTNLPKKAENF
jgi:hypothetical protein